MNILYVSALSSERIINDIYVKTQDNPGFAVQKFSRLLVRGIQENNVAISSLSSPPITSKYTSNKWIKLPDEYEENIMYKYVPYLNIPVLKNLCVFLYTFFYILFWGLGKSKDKVIICDVLTVGLSLGALLATKFNGVRCVGIVTDIFGLMVGAHSFKAYIAARVNQWYVTLFDKYILLTEQMNAKVNPHKKPFIIMEGLCDNSLLSETRPIVEKAVPRVVLYAGGIHERYGLKMLAEAFIRANISNAILLYYGSGPYVETFKELSLRHDNLVYGGVAPNNVILEEEYKASLLVNPRFTTEEFVQYSFPSKNMEFMSSGTPLLTTKLPGMPKEYYPYVYLFQEESVEGYTTVLKEVLGHSDDELNELGLKAKNFVLSSKNNIIQAKRIIEFIKSN